MCGTLAHDPVTPFPKGQDVDVWSSSCSLGTVVDLAALHTTNDDALSACAVATTLSTTDPPHPLQQRMYEACERSRSHSDKSAKHGSTGMMQWLAGAEPARDQVPAHSLRITCPQTHGDSAVDIVWAAYETQRTLQGGHTAALQWDAHNKDSSTVLTFANAAPPGAARVVVYDSPASMPSMQQLEGLLESHPATVVVRTAEANVGELALSVQEWVRIMQSYGYTCWLRMGAAGAMRATGCLSAALEEAAHLGDIVCVFRSLEDLFSRWST